MMHSDNFEDAIPYFTDCGVETIQVLISRNRYGRQVTESLIEYINMRVEMEKSIAKGFEKLAAFEFPTLKPIMKKALKSYKGGKIECGQDDGDVYLGSAILDIQKDLANQSKTHRIFAKSLETEVLAKFKKSFNEQMGTKMKHKSRLLDTAEDITKTTRKLDNMRVNHTKFLRVVAECESKVSADPANQKLEAELDRAKNTSNQSQQKIRDAQTALTSKKENFNHEITSAASEIMNQDYKRICTTIATMTTFATIIQGHDKASSRFATRMADRLELVDGLEELRVFNEKYVYPLLKVTKNQESSRQAKIGGHKPRFALEENDYEYEANY